MLKLSSVMIGSSDPKKLSDFYSKVLEKEPDMVQDNWYGYSVGDCYLSIGSHDKVKGQSANPERVIFNFETREVQEEFDRIKALGATVVAEPYKMEGWDKPGIATLADPEGNYFQLMHPWE